MTDPRLAPSNSGRPATPRWVKALGIAVLIIAVVVFAAMLALGGEHGPGRHTDRSDPGAKPVAALGTAS